MPCKFQDGNSQKSFAIALDSLVHPAGLGTNDSSV